MDADGGREAGRTRELLAEPTTTASDLIYVQDRQGERLTAGVPYERLMVFRPVVREGIPHHVAEASGHIDHVMQGAPIRLCPGDSFEFTVDYAAVTAPRPTRSAAVMPPMACE